MKMDARPSRGWRSNRQRRSFASGLFCKDAIFNQDVLLDERGVLGKDPRVFDDHSGTSGKKEFAGCGGQDTKRVRARQAQTRRRTRSDQREGRLVADQSDMVVKLEPRTRGTCGVTGPKKAF